MLGEDQPLLIQNAEHPNRETRKFTAKDAVEIFKALPDGMAKTYSTFGPIAILYSPGYWLIAPVVTGGLISVSDKTFEFLAERYPDNKLVKTIAKISKGSNELVINFFEDFGFTCSLLTTIAAEIGGIEYRSNYFAKIISPLASFIPASLVRYARYRHTNGLENGQALDVFAGTMQGANAPTFVTGLLQLQGVLPKASPIPSAVIATSGGIGFFSGLTRKSKPKLSFVLAALTEILEDASLATAFLAFPNDIYAAANEGEISDAFFYTNVSITLLYLITLLCHTGYTTKQNYQRVGAAAPDIEAGQGQAPAFFDINYDNDSENEELYALPVQPTGSPGLDRHLMRSPSTGSFFDVNPAEKPRHRRTASLDTPSLTF